MGLFSNFSWKDLIPGYGVITTPGKIRDKRKARSSASKSHYSAASRGNSKYSGGNFNNMPRNLMSDKAKREAGQRASGARYTAQAKAAGKLPLGPYRPSTGVKGESGGGGGDVGGYDDGSAAMMEDMINQMGAMRTPDAEVPQIDVSKILSAMFNPQFSFIDSEVKRTKKEGGRNQKEVKAAYKALEKSISKDDAADIKKSYKQATKENEAAGASTEKSLSKAMQVQAAERRKDAQNLGIESALGQDSSAQDELAKGLSDAAKTTQSQNQRLQELKKADEVLNRDAASSARFQGNESVATLKGQVADILAGLSERKSNVKSERARTKLQLDTQNQNAVLAAKETQAKEYEKMMDAQSKMFQDLTAYNLDTEKMRTDAELENAKLEQRRYDTDAKYANQSSSNKDASIFQKLIDMQPGGLGAKSIQGVVNNIDSIYAKGTGTYQDAYREYLKKYPKSARSQEAAREYLRLIGKR